MLEPSVLHSEAIAGLVQRHYDLPDVLQVTPIATGSATCRKITTVGGAFILKEFPARYTPGDVRHEPVLNRYLAERGFPVGFFLATREGPFIWVYRDRVFHLQEYVEGNIAAQNQAPPWLLSASGRLLGRLHAILDGFGELRRGFPETWFALDVGVHVERYGALIEAAEALPPGQTRDRVVHDLRYKSNLLPGLARMPFVPGDLTYRNSHGDYHVSQLICGEDAIRAVIDFSGACNLPATWEVIRSFTLAAPSCREARIEVAELVDYVKSYVAGGGRLDTVDLAAMPYLYLFHLARSDYGYRQFLHGDAPAETRKHLLRFGFWRTQMCRYLESHAPMLSDTLARLQM